jgi:Glycosyl hydrolase catalytic core
MRLSFKNTALLATICASTAMPAQFALSVNLSDSIRPVTHVASGSLYGLTESLPSDYANLVAPLKPNVFTQPALSGNGHQQGVPAAAVPVAAKLAATTGKVMIRLADVLPGWPYSWPGQAGWLSAITSVINAKKASGLSNFYGYEIFNEPDGTWQSANGDFNATCWKPAYDLIRSSDPQAKIIGPSYSYYNSASLKAFLTYCKANNCLPDIICWHQWGATYLSGAIDDYRAMEVSLGISPRAISINEYSSKTGDPYEGSPGYSVPFIAKFERKGVESACISWWFTGLPGRLGSLLTAKNEKGGGWHLYKWYGDMTGAMVKTVPPNDASEGVDAFAAIDKNAKVASIVIGGNNIGTVNVSISGIPSSFGTKVDAKLEYVTWKDKDSAVAGTTLISTKSYAVANGSISVPVEVTSQFYAYRIYITPSSTAPGAEFFQYANYAGLSTKLSVGTYTTAQLSAAGIPDNAISSIAVDAGLTVQIFDADNFQTPLGTFTAGVADLATVGAASKISSVKITTGTVSVRASQQISGNALRWADGALHLAGVPSGRVQITDSQGRSWMLDVREGQALTGFLPRGVYACRILNGSAGEPGSFVVLH